MRVRHPRGAVGFLGGLSGKLLLLTVAFVMLAEVLIFVPSVAKYAHTLASGPPEHRGGGRRRGRRASECRAAPRRASANPDGDGTKAIVIRRKDASRMIASVDMPPRSTANTT